MRGVVDRPTTHYVKTADGVHIAYQVLGEGPDLLFSIGSWWHLDYQWEIAGCRKQFERLARTHRVILFDKRGTGLSDRVPLDGVPDLGGASRAVAGADGAALGRAAGLRPGRSSGRR